MSRRSDERDVVFRFRPGKAVPYVHLHGDMVHWLEPSEMEPTPGGWLEASHRVGPGVYGYKFRPTLASA